MIGPLLKNMTPLSFERWKFKRSILPDTADVSCLGVDVIVVVRTPDALVSINNDKKLIGKTFCRRNPT